MALNLPNGAQAPDKAPETTLGERIVQRIQQLGIELPGQPQSAIPDLPPDITNVAPATLSFLLSQLSSWAAFLAPQVALAKAEAAICTDKAKWEKKINKDDRAALTWEQAKTEKSAYADVLDQLYKSVMRKREACSREITRITGGMPEPVPARRNQ